MGRTPGNPGKRPARTFARKTPLRVCLAGVSMPSERKPVEASFPLENAKKRTFQRPVTKRHRLAPYGSHICAQETLACACCAGVSMLSGNPAIGEPLLRTEGATSVFRPAGTTSGSTYEARNRFRFGNGSAFPNRCHPRR